MALTAYIRLQHGLCTTASTLLRHGFTRDTASTWLWHYFSTTLTRLEHNFYTTSTQLLHNFDMALIFDTVWIRLRQASVWLQQLLYGFGMASEQLRFCFIMASLSTWLQHGFKKRIRKTSTCLQASTQLHRGFNTTSTPLRHNFDTNSTWL